MDEVAATLPKPLAERLIARKTLFNWLDKRINKGRRVKTYSLRWFLMLSLLARWKSKRRTTLRHSIEVKHRDTWLETARKTLPQNYALAVEILKFRRLIKGYSDTHTRGQSKFDKVMTTAQSIAHRDDAADWAQRLLSAAIKDASGEALDGTIKTIESFA
jgi:indolepyruvate ferredoxin oxidoreductase beta subunit